MLYFTERYYRCPLVVGPNFICGGTAGIAIDLDWWVGLTCGFCLRNITIPDMYLGGRKADEIRRKEISNSTSSQTNISQWVEHVHEPIHRSAHMDMGQIAKCDYV